MWYCLQKNYASDPWQFKNLQKVEGNIHIRHHVMSNVTWQTVYFGGIYKKLTKTALHETES